MQETALAVAKTPIRLLAKACHKTPLLFLSAPNGSVLQAAAPPLPLFSLGPFPLPSPQGAGGEAGERLGEDPAGEGSSSKQTSGPKAASSNQTRSAKGGGCIGRRYSVTRLARGVIHPLPY